MNTFSKLALNSQFHTGIRKGAGILTDVRRTEVYRKVSKTRAELIAKPGYGNNRGIGDVQPFAPNTRVFSWPVEGLA